jgi:uncharacterized membrane protein YagU involved in acid resistance
MGKFQKLDATTVIVRFVFGAVIGGLLVLFSRPWRPMPLWLGITLPVVLGVLTVLFGDRFFARFLKGLRRFH